MTRWISKWSACRSKAPAVRGTDPNFSDVRRNKASRWFQELLYPDHSPDTEKSPGHPQSTKTLFLTLPREIPDNDAKLLVKLRFAHKDLSSV